MCLLIGMTWTPCTIEVTLEQPQPFHVESLPLVLRFDIVKVCNQCCSMRHNSLLCRLAVGFYVGLMKHWTAQVPILTPNVKYGSLSQIWI